MQESMKEAYNASLTKSSDYALELATAGGKTPAALRRHRWNQLEIKKIPCLSGEYHHASLRRMRGRQRRLSTLSENLGCGKLSLRLMTAR
jgi:hypothetical protein